MPVQCAPGHRQLVCDLRRDQLGVQGRILARLRAEAPMAAHQVLEGGQQAVGEGLAGGIADRAGHGCLLGGIGPDGAGRAARQRSLASRPWSRSRRRVSTARS